MGSRGSVIPLFMSIKNNIFPITDDRMTRFMITLEQNVDLLWKAFDDMIGGGVKELSMKIVEIAKVINPKTNMKLLV